MKKRRSDKELTIALCVSLTLHTGLVVLLIHEKIELLLHELSPPPMLVDARKPPKLEEVKEEPEATEPPPVLLQPDVKALKEFVPPIPPPPPPEPPKKKKPSDVNDENIEWGKKDGKGFAITEAPGKVPLSAKKGIEDQSFASRDPEGPQIFPEEPSISTAPPGENGDGRKAERDPLAGKGTQGDPAVQIGLPDTAVVPPAPLPDRIVTNADNSASHPQASGPSFSQQPVPEKRSPAEANLPAGERDDLPNDPALAQSEQILPIKQADVIGVRSNDIPYPEVVEALTRPPGVKLSPDQHDPIESAVLPNLATADVSAAPSIQPATASLEAKPPKLEEMAKRLGETDPMNGPAIVDAMSHTPSDKTIEGGPAVLPELALADQTGGAEIRDAIVQLMPDQPKPEEIALRVDQGVEKPTVAATNSTPAAQVASAKGGVPGPPVAAADPAPDTGLESDPFAKIPGIDFHDGKVDARSGREVKPIRPRLSEAGRRDLLAKQFPTLVFKVRIDKTGKVKDVSVIQGSGSEAIDMPVYRSLWEWWFEPPKDKQGNPLEDVQLVSIHWG